MLGPGAQALLCSELIDHRCVPRHEWWQRVASFIRFSASLCCELPVRVKSHNSSHFVIFLSVLVGIPNYAFERIFLAELCLFKFLEIELKRFDCRGVDMTNRDPRWI
jgi:hypothetical protein